MDELVKIYLPIILTTVISIIASAISVMAWLIRKHLAGVSSMGKEIRKLIEAQIRTNEELIKHAAADELLRVMITEQTKAMAKLDQRFDAVFRYIDSPKRATDRSSNA